MGIKTLMTIAACGLAYFHFGPYHGYTDEQAQDTKIIAGAMFAEGDFQFDQTGISAYVPTRLPTAPSSRVEHVGVLPTGEADIETYASTIAHRAQGGVDYSTMLTELQIEQGCKTDKYDGQGHRQCHYNYFVETDYSVYEATLTIKEIREGRFYSELLLTPVHPSE